eukprot:6155185-Amphidinium_carterae.3
MAASGSGVTTPVAKASKLKEMSVAAKAVKKPRMVEETDSVSGAIKKCVYDNFLRKGWSQDSVTGLVINGLSIYDRLTRDKKQWLATGEPVMGKTYFRNIKKMYKGNPDDATVPLLVDLSLPLNPRLHSAVVKMKKNAPDRAPFANYLDCCEDLNKRELVGVIRCFASMEPAAGQAQRRACLAVMKAITRLGLEGRWPDVVESVQEKMEQTMVQVHIEALKVGTQDWEFLDMHAKTWPLVMRADQVSLIRALAADQPWSQVKSALTEVCATSELGRRIFGDKLGELVKDDLKGIVKRAVAKIFALD